MKTLVDIASSVLTEKVPTLAPGESHAAIVSSVPLSTLRVLAAVTAVSTDELGRADVAASLASKDSCTRTRGAARSI